MGSEIRGKEPLEPIAIIGMGCRLPGGASSPSQLWAQLTQGQSAWSPPPKERFNMDAFHEASNSHSTTTNTPGGHFLKENIKAFDARFFGINPVEAIAMDPQQRFMLEVAYETFENAGFDLASIKKTNTGVYVGQWSSDYSEILARDPEYATLYHTTGAGAAITSNRVSYCFDLKGPSFTVDTGCSASLVALHSAVQGLRLGETKMALVGGVNMLLDPQRFTYQSKLKMFSSQGRSFSFDHRADGYGRGEGCCAVVLKPLSAAIRDNDPIRAVIRNSVLNQDGRTPGGISVPSGQAQEDAIRTAYAHASLFLDVDYVEAHGTGTAVGDPIEVGAIAAALGIGRGSKDKLPVGSIKGNIGHTESCAGLAGLIKAVLMLEKNLIPPQVNFEKPNPKLRLDEWNLRIPTHLESKTLSRISVNSFGYGGTNAHVILEKQPSTFGFSEPKSMRNGTHETVPVVNGAHAPVNGTTPLNGEVSGTTTNGTVPKEDSHHNDDQVNQCHQGKFEVHSAYPMKREQYLLFMVSGFNDDSCRANASRIAEYVQQKQQEPQCESPISTKWLHRLAYTLNSRTLHQKVAFVTAKSPEQLSAKMLAVSQKPTLFTSKDKDTGSSCGGIAFVFTGQGAQYHDMGRQLIGTNPVFSASLKRAQQALASLGSSWDILEELRKGPRDTAVNNPGLGQPLTTVVQLALVDMLAALGITPAAVVGHSSGEVAAAYAAKILSFEDAVCVSYFRGKLTQEMIVNKRGTKGAMLAVGISAMAMEQYMNELSQEDSEKLCIACFNGPTSVTMSGDEEAIDNLADLLEDASVFHRKLRTNGAAYHSGAMKQISEEYRKSMEAIQPALASDVRMVSSVISKPVKDQLLDASYWVSNLVSPVRFSDALKRLIQPVEGTDEASRGNQIHTILEIGPHSQLKGPVEQTLQTLKADLKTPVTYVATLIRNTDAEASMLECMAQLRLHGHNVDLHLANNCLDRRRPQLLMDVPPYAFDHKNEYWHESRTSQAFRNRQFLPHELIGNQVVDCVDQEPRWRQFVRLENMPWLRDHIVQGQVVFPAAGYLTMALEAIKRHKLTQRADMTFASFEFQRVSIGKALLISEDKVDLELSISLRPETRTVKASSDSWMEFKVFSTSQSQPWTEHCRGLIQANVALPSTTSAIAVSHQRELLIPGSDTFLDDTSLKAPRRQVGVNKFYHLCREIGLDWKGPFASVKHLESASQTCFTNTTIPRVDSANELEASSPQATYTIHPATLDACLFHGLCATLVLEDGIESAVVPTFINNLSISSHISKLPGSLLKGYSRRAPGRFTFDVMIREGDEMDSTQGPLVVYAEGVTASQLAAVVPTGNAVARQLCHRMSQVVYCDTLSSQQLIDHCKKDVPEGSVLEQNKQLEALVQQYINTAVRGIRSEQVTVPHRRAWLEWMHESFKKTSQSSSNQERPVDLGILGETIHRMGPKLKELLTGELDPLLLFSDGNLLTRLYTEERCPRCYSQIGQYVLQLSMQKPGLKMIEIGGGTASASLEILQNCQASNGNLISVYDFTDVSTGFFSAAKDRLSKFEDIVDYKALDIENDPESQGFELGTYDVVVACNVIHASTSIGKSVNYAKSLLKPGGILVLMEITRAQLYYSLVFGAFAGWWAGSEEGRKLSPLLTPDQWSTELSRLGFVNTTAHFVDYPDNQGGTLSVFLAKVPETVSGVSPLSTRLIHNSEDNMQMAGQLALSLKTMDNRSVSIFQLDSTATAHEGVAIFFPEVIHSLATSVTPEQWDRFKAHIFCSKACLFLTVGGNENVQDPRGGLIPGFLRCLRLEHPDIRLVSLDLDPGPVEASMDNHVLAVTKLLNTVSFDLTEASSNVDTEFTERNGQLSVARVLHDDQLDTAILQANGEAKTELVSFFHSGRLLQAKLSTPGLLETLSWTDMPPEQERLGDNEVKIELHAASINFKDVLIAAGQLEGLTDMKNDCSGIVVETGSAVGTRFQKGDRVCAYYSQSYNNYPVVSADCCAHIPNDMSWEEAASIPIVWGTVFFSIMHKARLQRGESILIHSGAGAVGQAAIALSQHLGAEVYATAGSEAKREFLMQKYNIPADHLFSSRDTQFARGIKAQTQGKGVDVVLNSLSGELFRESCNVVKKFGQFVEIGRKDFLDNALMPSKFLLNNITFALVDLAQIIEENKVLAKQVLEETISFLTGNDVMSVDIKTMSISEIETAFRQIQAGKHTGKIVLTVEDGQLVKALHPAPPLAKLREDGCYLVVGGFGGLGRVIVEWLARQGARRVVVLSRSEVDSDKIAFMDRVQSETGATVLAKRCRVEDEADLRDCLASVPANIPVRGVIHSAMVLKDCVLDDMSFEQWKSSLDPKVKGSWNLHNVLDNQHLDFFILLSSAVAISGNFGQSNYAGACSYQDALARYRRSLGLASFSINVGAVVEAGFVSENPEVAMMLRRQGLGTITSAQLLALINHIVVNGSKGSYDDCQRSIGLLPSGTELGLQQSTWLSETRFAHLTLSGSSAVSTGKSSTDVVHALQNATDDDDSVDIICRSVMQQLSKLVSVPLDEITAEQSLDDYGVDSLIAVELRNWIATRLQASVSILVLRESRSLLHLARIIFNESNIVASRKKQ